MFWVRRLIWYVSLFLLTFLLLYLSVTWYRFLTTPLVAKKAEATTVIVTPNLRLKALAFQLHDRGLLPNTQLFIALARLTRDAQYLFVGEYSIDPGMTPSRLISNLYNGRVTLRKITFFEGITFDTMRDLLLQTTALKTTLKAQNNQAIMTALGHPEQSPEGRFFPDTYLYTWGNDYLLILRHAYELMQERLSDAWSKRAKDLPYKTPDEALIVASLVESETFLDEERARIAGVIIRRLQKNMPLQVDTTVLYGVKKPFGSVVTADDLQAKNPYNTYQRLGLPPTPINMPGQASIEAALHPNLEDDALYYVVKGNDGSHQFSRTYKEHQKAVRQYREKM